RHPVPNPDRHEDLLAELAEAAYRVALRHGIKGSFIDVEIDLWHGLREVLRKAGNTWEGGRVREWDTGRVQQTGSATVSPSDSLPLPLSPSPTLPRPGVEELAPCGL